MNKEKSNSTGLGTGICTKCGEKSNNITRDLCSAHTDELRRERAAQAEAALQARADAIGFDWSKLEDVEVDGVDSRDYPDFCDAYICSATYDGRDATEAELDFINDDSDFVYNAVINYIY